MGLAAQEFQGLQGIRVDVVAGQLAGIGLEDCANAVDFADHPRRDHRHPDAPLGDPFDQPVLDEWRAERPPGPARPPRPERSAVLLSIIRSPQGRPTQQNLLLSTRRSVPRSTSRDDHPLLGDENFFPFPACITMPSPLGQDLSVLVHRKRKTQFVCLHTCIPKIAG